MRRQHTATLYVVYEDRILLHFHKKFNKWLPAGGHVEENEMPHEAALREAFEETGLTCQIIEQENIKVHEKNAVSIPRPYLTLLENIPTIGKDPAHQHIDFIYVGTTDNPQTNGVEECRWFSIDDINRLVDEVEVFRDIKQVAKQILVWQKLSSSQQLVST